MGTLRYPIRAVSRLTGIPVDTLRAWERRHAVVAPERDERGRTYSEQDVERLRLLRRAVEAGHAIGRVARLTTVELQALTTSGPGPVHEPPARLAPTDLTALLGAVERFDAPALRRELSRLAAILPPRSLARDVALPLMHLVGEAWHAGKLTIAHEHLVTAELRSLLGALSRLHAIPDARPRLLLATPSGEAHELGILVAALVASGAGCATFYLGPNLPADEIISSARRISAKAVLAGFSGSQSAPQALGQLEVLARGLPPEVELWVGGAGAAEARARLAGTRAVILGDFDAFEATLERLRG